MSSISVYIHWPFCLSLCPYCDFNSHIGGGIDHTRWLKAYEREIDHFSPIIKGKEVKSIFFGGGTPSLMEPYVVEGIINKIASISPLSPYCEITLEANPTSFEIQKFRQFKAAGVNRVSIGVQSFNPEDLLALGRKHSTLEAVNAIKAAASIFSRYSFDLIYARPNQSLKAWEKELKYALTLAGGHLSLYQLTIEKGTPFFTLFRSNKLPMPSNDLSAELYEWTNNQLEKNHYHRYEISNYAKNGEECLHNLCYWNYEEYVGIGPGAHSRIHHIPRVLALMTFHKPDKWLAAVEASGHGVQRHTNLTRTEIIEEFIMMGTRLSAGAQEEPLQRLLKLGFADIFNQKVLDDYIKGRLLSIDSKTLKLSDSGLLLHSYLVPRLFKHL